MSYRIEYRCVSCKRPFRSFFLDSEMHHNGGACPGCGVIGPKASATVADHTRHPYRLEETGKWWQFWKKPKRVYLDTPKP